MCPYCQLLGENKCVFPRDPCRARLLNERQYPIGHLYIMPSSVLALLRPAFQPLAPDLLDCRGVFGAPTVISKESPQWGSLRSPLPPGYCPQKMPLPMSPPPSRNVYSTMTPFRYIVPAPKNTIHSIACPPSYHPSDGVRFETKTTPKSPSKNINF